MTHIKQKSQKLPYIHDALFYNYDDLKLYNQRKFIFNKILNQNLIILIWSVHSSINELVNNDDIFQGRL